MNHERAKELLPIIQAYAEGKTIQFRRRYSDVWADVRASEPSFDDLNLFYRIKPEEDTEITSIEELKEAIFSKKKEIQSKGGDASLFLYITISENMVKAIEKRYSCVFRTAKGSVNTFFGIPFVVGDATKVEIRDRFVELLKKEHKEYRPFKDCKELIAVWEEKTGYIPPKDLMPIIWLKNIDNTISLITDYKQIISPDEGLLCSWVTVDGDNYNMQGLFENYTFFDGSPCGVSNGKEESDTEN